MIKPMKKLLYLLLILPLLFSCASTEKQAEDAQVAAPETETIVKFVTEKPIEEEPIKVDSWVSSSYVANGLLIEMGFDGENYFLTIPYQLNYFLEMELLEDGTLCNLPSGIIISGDFFGNANYDQLDYHEEIIFEKVSDDFKAYYTREQDPKDFPYNSEEVTIKVSEDVILSGTITSPYNDNKDTAVLFITGSGQQDRNSEIANHRPFLVASDYLTRNGIAVLRYDDRGAGKSIGDVENLTTFDSADDASAAVDFLKAKGYKKIILVGHSEGGTIAPIVASNNSNVDGLILLAPPALSGLEISLDQNRTSLRFAGYDETSISVIVGILELGFKHSLALERDKAIEYFSSLFGEAAAIENYEYVQTPWIRAFFELDPKEYLKNVKVPTYILQGMKDTQVTPNINLVPLKAALEESGTVHEVFEYENLNHLFQTCETGNITEYGFNEETISEEVLAKIVEILNRF